MWFDPDRVSFSWIFPMRRKIVDFVPHLLHWNTLLGYPVASSMDRRDQHSVALWMYTGASEHCFKTDLNLSLFMSVVNTSATFLRLNSFCVSCHLLEVQTSTFFQNNPNTKDLTGGKIIQKLLLHFGIWQIVMWQFWQSLIQSGLCWIWVMGVWSGDLAVFHSLQWHVVLFVETRVSSSGETWQAKLIEIVIISVAQG